MLPILATTAHVCVAYVQLLVRIAVQVKEVQDVNIETAMQLYQLEHFELVSTVVCYPVNKCKAAIDIGLPSAIRQYPLQLWERRLDTKALIAWNQKTVVLSFRGTATFSNVLADLSVSSMEGPGFARLCANLLSS